MLRMRPTLFILAAAAATALAQTDTATPATKTPMPNFTPDAAIITAAGPIVGAIVGSIMGGIGIMGLIGYGLYRYDQAQREAKVIERIAIVPPPA
jgi:hypothetical protein